MAELIDFKKDQLYKAKPEPQLVTIPSMQFVMVDGKGAPDSGTEDTASEFQKAMGVLFGVVYTIKFWDKKFSPPPGYAKFTLPPIEGLWWMANGKEFDMKQPDAWRWTVMMRLPGFVTPAYFKEVVEAVAKAKKDDTYHVARLETFEEGKCVQLMHIGPYDQEGPNIEKMHAFANEKGYKLRGKHHELYFGDPRRTAPEKLKTILRQPIED